MPEEEDTFDRECGPGWVRGGDNCYQLRPDATTWHMAKSNCQSTGPDSELVYITSKAEEMFVRSKFMHCPTVQKHSITSIFISRMKMRPTIVFLNVSRLLKLDSISKNNTFNEKSQAYSEKSCGSLSEKKLTTENFVNNLLLRYNSLQWCQHSN